eukprot:c38918_g1_i1 orf=226-564(+)
MAAPDLRLALAVALVKARSCKSSSSLLHWKRKAKLRKSEVIALKQELQEIQDSMVLDMLPPAITCRCCFFKCGEQNLGTQSSNTCQTDINQLLFRRFLRNVNMWEHAKNHNH